MLRRITTAVLTAAMVMVFTQAYAADKEQGVYVKLITKMKADITETAQKAGAALEAAGFEVLSTYQNGVPEGCDFRAMTIVFTSQEYADAVLAGGLDKGFGLPLRLGLYEDEHGLNIAVVNPVSINRTLFADTSMDGVSEALVGKVKVALDSVGPTMIEHIGQLRETGEITGIGGGAFADKIIDVKASAESIDGIAASLDESFSDAAGWRSIYTYSPNQSLTIVGVTDTATEGRAFGIAGEKRSTKGYRFPGIDHAAAFPIEILIYKKAAGNTAVIVKEMWRMKLYFQDAGNWAFMKNMGMPGDIQDAIEKRIIKVMK